MHTHPVQTWTLSQSFPSPSLLWAPSISSSFPWRAPSQLQPCLSLSLPHSLPLVLLCKHGHGQTTSLALAPAFSCFFFPCSLSLLMQHTHTTFQRGQHCKYCVEYLPYLYWLHPIFAIFKICLIPQNKKNDHLCKQFVCSIPRKRLPCCSWHAYLLIVEAERIFPNFLSLALFLCVPPAFLSIVWLFHVSLQCCCLIETVVESKSLLCCWKASKGCLAL